MEVVVNGEKVETRISHELYSEFKCADLVRYNDEFGLYECSEEELKWWESASNCYEEAVETLEKHGIDYTSFCNYLHFQGVHLEYNWEGVAQCAGDMDYINGFLESYPA